MSRGLVGLLFSNYAPVNNSSRWNACCGRCAVVHLQARSLVKYLGVFLTLIVASFASFTGGGTKGSAVIDYYGVYDSTHSTWVITTIDTPSVPNANLRFQGAAVIGDQGTQFVVTNGATVQLRLNNADNTWTYSTAEFYLEAVLTVPIFYKVTFVIPANPTDSIVRYEAWQDGVSVGSVTQDPHAAAYEKTFDHLTSDHVVVLNEVHSNLVQTVMPDGTIAWTFGPSDYVRTVNGGATPVLSSGSNSPAPVVSPIAPATTGTNRTPAPVVGPLGPLAPITPASPPSPAPVVSNPTGQTAPNPSPSGTGGTTKADTEKQSNDITAAVNTLGVSITASGNGIIGAVNSMSTANVDASGKVVQAVNATNAKLVELGNKQISLLQQLNDNTNKSTNDNSTAQQALLAANPSADSITSGRDAAKGGVESAVGGRAAPNFGTASPPSSGDFAISVGAFHADFDPANSSQFVSLAAFVKACVAWIVTVLFEMYVWNYFRNIWTVLTTTPQTHGNPVLGGTGAQGTAFIAAAALTAVLVSFPTLFWAAADSGMTWTAALSVNPVALASGSSFLSKGSYLFGFFMPVGTLVAALTSFFVLQRAGLVLLAGAQIVVKWIFP